MVGIEKRLWFRFLFAFLGCFLGCSIARPASAAPEKKPPQAKSGHEVEHNAAKTEKGSPAVDKPNPCNRGRELLAEYLSLYGLTKPAEASKGEKNPPFGDPSDYLIGIVPDPDISGHDGYFEATLEGIEEAVAAGDKVVPPGDKAIDTYDRDRSWLPWRSAKGEKKHHPCAGEEPGLILFRPRHPLDQHPKIVLLVGETPTWGVRTKQLDAAILLAQGAGSPSERVVRVLGPTFSGTASSLAAILRKYAVGPRPTKFTLVSGTATNPELWRIFKGVADFSATVPDDEKLLSAMLRYLDVRGAESNDGKRYSNIALLSESLTAYGSAVDASSGKQAGKELDPKLSLRFPANLAALRDAPITSPPAALPSFEGDTSSEEADTAQESTESTEEETPSKEASSAGATEESKPSPAPVASGGAATNRAASTDVLVLDEVARDLSRQRVRFVGVVATEASDVILLTKRLRSKLPDVRFFTLGADIEYLDSESANSLNGMLVAHAPPSTNQVGQSVSLKNELVRNVFLAGRSLLTGSAVEEKPTRISMIGNGALWGLVDDLGWRDAPMSWWFVFYASLLTLAMTILLVGWPFLIERFRWITLGNKVGFARHRGPIWILIGRCEHADLRADDALVTASLLSVAGSAPLLMCVALWARGRWWEWQSLLCFLATLLVFGLSWSGVLWGVLSSRNKDPKPSKRGVGSRAAIVFSSLGSLAALFALGIGCEHATEATLNLMSGGSAVLAGLIGFGMTWLGLWCWRVRLRFLDMHHFGALPPKKGEDKTKGEEERGSMTPPIAQALGQTTEGGGDIAEIEQRLLRVLRSPWLSFLAVPACVHALLAVSFFAVMAIRSPAGFEPAWRNKLIVAFGLLSLLPITGNFSRIVATWIVLIRLLRRLGRLPVLESLRKLPPELARDFEGQLTVSTADIGELFYPIGVLEKIAAKNPAFAGASQEARELWNKEMGYEAGVTPDGGAAKSHETTEIRARLVKILLDASGRLTVNRESLDEENQALADELLAQLIAIFIPRYVRHFRLFVPPMLVGSALGVLMTSLYFIQPQRLLTTLIFLWVAGMVLVVFAVYTSLDRDAVVSALGDTKAGSVELDWNLLRRVITWGIVPVVSLFAAQYPDFSYWIALLVNGLGKALR